MVFVQVRTQIVQFDRSVRIHLHALPYALPFPLTHGLLAARLVELPVQVVMLRLAAFSRERRNDRDAVLHHRVGKLRAGNLRKGRQHVPESADMLARASGLDAARRPCDQRQTDSALIQIALDTPEWSAAVEKVRIGSALPVGSVVAREQNQRILVQPELLQQREHLSHVFVQPGDHRGERGIGLRLGAITRNGRVRAVVSGPVDVGFLFEFSPVGADDFVVGNQQFGMG